MEMSSSTGLDNVEPIVIEPDTEGSEMEQQPQPMSVGTDGEVAAKVDMDVSNGVADGKRTLRLPVVPDDQSSDLVTSDSHDECPSHVRIRSAAVAICDTADASGETSSSGSAPGDGWIIVPKQEPADVDSTVAPSSVSTPELLPHPSEVDAMTDDSARPDGNGVIISLDRTPTKQTTTEAANPIVISPGNTPARTAAAVTTSGGPAIRPAMRKYRDHDLTSATSDSSEESSDDSSDIDASSSSEAGPAIMKKKPERPRKKLDAVAEDGVQVRTMGEVLLEELPAIEDLQITVGDDVVLEEMGKVASIVGTLVVVQAKCDLPKVKPLDYGTILFTEEKVPIGQVFETFGRVDAPMYTIRFNSTDHMNKRGVKVNLPLFYAPNMETFTKYVFTEQLRRDRGSDASWEHNNEPPDKFLEYSDDEKERHAKRQQKVKRDDKDEFVEGEGMEDGDKKRRKKRKPLRKKPNANGYTADISDSDGFQGGDSSGSGSYFHQVGATFSPAPWPPTGRSRWRQPPPPASTRPWYNRMPYPDGANRERTPWDRQQRPTFRTPSHPARPSYRTPNPSFKSNRFQHPAHPNDFQPSFPPQPGPPMFDGRPNQPPDYNMGNYNANYNPNFNHPPPPPMGGMGPPPPPSHPNFPPPCPPPPGCLPQPQFGGHPRFPQGPPPQQWPPG